MKVAETIVNMQMQLDNWIHRSSREIILESARIPSLYKIVKTTFELDIIIDNFVKKRK